MEQSARGKLYERIEAAPLAARGFFKSLDEHFRQRNDPIVLLFVTGMQKRSEIILGYTVSIMAGFALTN